MKETEFQAQIESDFDEKQMDMLHEEFQLKHNEFMGDVAGQPDIPPEPDITYVVRNGRWVNKNTGEKRPLSSERNSQPDVSELTYAEHQAAQHKFIMTEDKDITEYVDKDGKWVNAKTGEPKVEPPHDQQEFTYKEIQRLKRQERKDYEIQKPTSPYQGDPFAENEEMYVKPSQSTEDDYEYVNQPSHYQYFDMEVIDAIERTLTHEQFKGFLMGTSMRYRFRCGAKKGEPLERDINKAKRYEQYWYDYVKRNTP